MQLHTKVVTTALVTLMSVVLGSVMISHSAAQTDFNIQNDQLESQHKEELDKWMLRAYEGDRDAQFKVGVLFTNKQSGSPDFEQAVYWYKQAARQGHVLAQYNLGHQYLSGVGAEKSEAKAMEWWLNAAKQGHALAQFNIGRAYYLGIGLNEDHKQSRDWFERAARSGEPKSIEILEQLGWAEKGQYTEQVVDTNSNREALVSKVAATPSTLAKQPSTSNSLPSTLDEQPSTSDSRPSATLAADSPDSKTNISASDTAAPDVQPDETTKKSPIALYTNPKVRSVLISIIDSRDHLELLEESETWSAVTSRVGFPVWIHGDFIKVTDGKGIITGDSVNARSVPIVTNGTVVGRLNRNEKVVVLDQRNEWLRITAPPRFKAWVKTNDYKATAKPVKTPNAAIPSATSTATAQPSSKLNDNAWLFSQAPDNYTLQLASFDDPVKVSEFVSDSNFTNDSDLHRFAASGKDISWTYFLYGEYANKDQAEVAKQKVKQTKAWVRSFGRLQQNRCVAWKKQLPTPTELNTYCVD